MEQTLNELLKQARGYVYNPEIANKAIPIPGTNVEVAYNPFTAVCVIYDTSEYPMAVLFKGNRENAAIYIAENILKE